MLSSIAKTYIEASVPVLREHGLSITKTFYKNMFAAHPELRNLFNMGNQANGSQQQSLASALFAYAANVEEADALTPVVERIAHKHASIGIRAEHYPIVGEHLIKAIKVVLAEAATQPLLDAWTEAYSQLADTLTNAEKALYAARNQAPDSWLKAEVTAIEQHSADMTSYTLKPTNDAAFSTFKPGQYISVAGYIPSLKLRQIRQYSLSDLPDKGTYRVTIKAEPSGDKKPAGTVSNWLKETAVIGSTLEISAPFGNFTADVSADQPITLISSGVGITPMLSILNAIASQNPNRKVVFAHAAKSIESVPHLDEIIKASDKMRNIDIQLYLKEENTQHPFTIQGRIDASQFNNLKSAIYYICGSQTFMDSQQTALVKLGVNPTQIQREMFGPESLSHLI